MNMQTRERIARTAVWAAACLGLGLAASAQASGVTLQPLRPRAEPLHAPVSVKPRIKRPARRATIQRHIGCVAVRRAVNAMWADRVRLTNDGQTAIPPGITVYWYMRNDHRIWGAHRFAGGLPRGASALADMHAGAGAGLPCTVVFRRLAWMIPHPVAPGSAIRRATPGIAPLRGRSKPGIRAGTSKPGIQATRQHAYVLTCKLRGEYGIGNAMNGAGPGYMADVTNGGVWSVPAGAYLGVKVDGNWGRGEKLIVPLRHGQKISIPQFPPNGGLSQMHTCSAYAG